MKLQTAPHIEIYSINFFSFIEKFRLTKNFVAKCQIVLYILMVQNIKYLQTTFKFCCCPYYILKQNPLNPISSPTTPF